MLLYGTFAGAGGAIKDVYVFAGDAYDVTAELLQKQAANFQVRRLIIHAQNLGLPAHSGASERT